MKISIEVEFWKKCILEDRNGNNTLLDNASFWSNISFPLFQKILERRNEISIL